jgi:hypothetical protein
MATYSISTAARLCHCDRRTLQRAIHAGRLHLDAQHCLSREELIATGYLVPETPQDAPRGTPRGTPREAPQETPHPMSQETPQSTALLPLLERLAVATERLWQELERLREHQGPPPPMTPQGTPQRPPQQRRRTTTPVRLITPRGTPHCTPQKAPHGTPQMKPQEAPQLSDSQRQPMPGEVPPFDTSKFVLGKLCPRGHEYHGTGMTLRRVFRHVCPACDVERTREARQAKRKGAS